MKFGRRATAIGLAAAALIGSTAMSASAYTGRDLQFLRGVPNHVPYADSAIVAGGHEYCNNRNYYNRNIPWYKIGSGQSGAAHARQDEINRFGYRIGSLVAAAAEVSYC